MILAVLHKLIHYKQVINIIGSGGSQNIFINTRIIWYSWSLLRWHRIGLRSRDAGEDSCGSMVVRTSTSRRKNVYIYIYYCIQMSTRFKSFRVDVDQLQKFPPDRHARGERRRRRWRPAKAFGPYLPRRLQQRSALVHPLAFAPFRRPFSTITSTLFKVVNRRVPRKPLMNKVS